MRYKLFNDWTPCMAINWVLYAQRDQLVPLSRNFDFKYEGIFKKFIMSTSSDSVNDRNSS